MRTIHQQKVDKFMELAGQNVPKKTGIPDDETLQLRANLILEECLETIKALGFAIYDQSPKNGNIINPEDITLKKEYETDIVEVADGCADIKVVTTGTLSSFGIDDNEIQEAVDENNLAKFGPGSYRREDGKWMKPPNHQPPNIKEIISNQE